MKVTQEVFNQLKEGQDSGIRSAEAAKEMELSLSDVNDVYASENWKEYISKFGSDADRSSVVTPVTAGYYRSLVVQKLDENNSLKGTREWLLEQVRFLRKAVKFLENRRNELEKGVSELENNVKVGIDIMEQLEDNEDFQKAVNGKPAKRN